MERTVVFFCMSWACLFTVIPSCRKLPAYSMVQVLTIKKGAEGEVICPTFDVLHLKFFLEPVNAKDLKSIDEIRFSLQIETMDQTHPQKLHVKFSDLEPASWTTTDVRGLHNSYALKPNIVGEVMLGQLKDGKRLRVTDVTGLDGEWTLNASQAGHY